MGQGVKNGSRGDAPCAGGGAALAPPGSGQRPAQHTLTAKREKPGEAQKKLAAEGAKQSSAKPTNKSPDNPLPHPSSCGGSEAILRQDSCNGGGLIQPPLLLAQVSNRNTLRLRASAEPPPATGASGSRGDFGCSLAARSSGGLLRSLRCGLGWGRGCAVPLRPGCAEDCFAPSAGDVLGFALGFFPLGCPLSSPRALPGPARASAALDLVRALGP